MEIAYIGLGSNRGDRRENLERALEYLRSRDDVEVLTVGELIETAPDGGPSQPPFLNGVARIRTSLPPVRLLEVLKDAERFAGRQKSGVHWGPREADLDLLLYGDRIVRSPTLTVPHPRMRERRFVLEPLAAIAPETKDPETGKTIRALLRDLLDLSLGRKPCRVARTVAELRSYGDMARRNRFTIGFVPTMGAFHEGHLSLMRAARAHSDKVVASIFVNPTQFGPGEDLESYPRQLDADTRAAAEAGVDLVFAPTPQEIYPAGDKTRVEVEELSDLYCGARRPGHFRGVATVVLKLLHLVEPETVWFGAKDWQQTVVIRRMVRDLHLAVQVHVLPTIREEDGLALSSRNVYLSPEERKKATALYRGLTAAKAAWDEGERVAESLVSRVRDVLEAEEGLTPEYVAMADPATLAPLNKADDRAILLAAARLGDTRLIDNLLLGRDE